MLLRKNSNNSSYPPSSDGLKRTIKNNREKSNRKHGAQNEHQGSGLSPFTEVDKEVECKVEGKCNYRAELSKQKTIGTEKRQLIDLPEKLFEIIE